MDKLLLNVYSRSFEKNSLFKVLMYWLHFPEIEISADFSNECHIQSYSLVPNYSVHLRK